jgi:hypothetical protein
VKLVAGLDDWENVFDVLAGHSNENALLLALTDSLKLTVIVELTPTPVAPSAGEKLLTLGAESAGGAST